MARYLQTDMNIKEGTKQVHTFLWYYKNGNDPLTNYPLVFGKYSYQLNIDAKDNVKLLIDTIYYDKPFYIEFGQTANIEKLSVQFAESIDVMGDNLGNNGTNENTSYAEYQLVISDGGEQKRLSFTSLNFNEITSTLQWKDYEIKVLYTNIRLLKLNVYKIAEKKK